MITASISDSVGSLTFPDLEVPLTIETLDSSVDITTLSNDIRTDFFGQKKRITVPYDSLTEDEFNDFKEFFDRQFTSLEFPTISIPYFDIEDLPVRMYLTPRQVYNNCGSVQNVEIVFRESQPMTVGSS